MKIAVLSDTHISTVTRELVQIHKDYLADADMILHAGDIVSSDVVSFLDRGNFHGVSGNMDPYDVRDMLPVKKIINAGSQRIGLIHGWGFSSGLEQRILAEFEDVDAIVYGHSHKAANHIRNNILFFNPGSAIGFRPASPRSMGFLEIEGDEIRGRIVELR